MKLFSHWDSTGQKVLVNYTWEFWIEFFWKKVLTFFNWSSFEKVGLLQYRSYQILMLKFVKLHLFTISNLISYKNDSEKHIIYIINLFLIPFINFTQN